MRRALLLAALAFGAASATAATSADGAVVGLSLLEATTRARIGDTASAVLLVENSGNATGHAYLVLWAPDWLTARVEGPNPLRLEAGRASTWRIEADVLASAPNGTRSFEAEAILLEDPATRVSLGLRLDVVEPDPPRSPDAPRGNDTLVAAGVPVVGAQDAEALLVAPATAASDDLVLANLADRPLRLTVATRSLALDFATLAVSASPSALDLGPGESGRFRLTIHAPGAVPVGEERQAALEVAIEGAAPAVVGIRMRFVPDAVPAGFDVHPAVVALGASAALALAANALLRNRPDRRYDLLAQIALPLARLRQPNARDRAKRERILGLVREAPGISYSQLRIATRLPAVTLVTHLRTLERDGVVTSRREGLHRRFEPAAVASTAAEATTPTEARILEVLEGGPLSLAALAERSGLAARKASHHLRALARDGRIAAVERDGVVRYHRVLPAEREGGPRRR